MDLSNSNLDTTNNLAPTPGAKDLAEVGGVEDHHQVVAESSDKKLEASMDVTPDLNEKGAEAVPLSQQDDVEVMPDIEDGEELSHLKEPPQLVILSDVDLSNSNLDTTNNKAPTPGAKDLAEVGGVEDQHQDVAESNDKKLEASMGVTPDLNEKGAEAEPLSQQDDVKVMPDIEDEKELSHSKEPSHRVEGDREEQPDAKTAGPSQDSSLEEKRMARKKFPKNTKQKERSGQRMKDVKKRKKNEKTAQKKRPGVESSADKADNCADNDDHSVEIKHLPNSLTIDEFIRMMKPLGAIKNWSYHVDTHIGYVQFENAAGAYTAHRCLGKTTMRQKRMHVNYVGNAHTNYKTEGKNRLKPNIKRLEYRDSVIIPMTNSSDKAIEMTGCVETNNKIHPSWFEVFVPPKQRNFTLTLNHGKYSIQEASDEQLERQKSLNSIIQKHIINKERSESDLRNVIEKNRSRQIQKADIQTSGDIDLAAFVNSLKEEQGVTYGDGTESQNKKDLSSSETRGSTQDHEQIEGNLGLSKGLSNPRGDESLKGKDHGPSNQRELDPPHWQNDDPTFQSWSTLEQDFRLLRQRGFGSSSQQDHGLSHQRGVGSSFDHDFRSSHRRGFGSSHEQEDHGHPSQPRIFDNSTQELELGSPQHRTINYFYEEDHYSAPPRGFNSGPTADFGSLQPRACGSSHEQDNVLLMQRSSRFSHEQDYEANEQRAFRSFHEGEQSNSHQDRFGSSNKEEHGYSHPKGTDSPHDLYPDNAHQRGLNYARFHEQDPDAFPQEELRSGHKQVYGPPQLGGFRYKCPQDDQDHNSGQQKRNDSLQEQDHDAAHQNIINPSLESHHDSDHQKEIATAHEQDCVPSQHGGFETQAREDADEVEILDPKINDPQRVNEEKDEILLDDGDEEEIQILEDTSVKLQDIAFPNTRKRGPKLSLEEKRKRLPSHILLLQKVYEMYPFTSKRIRELSSQMSKARREYAKYPTPKNKKWRNKTKRLYSKAVTRGKKESLLKAQLDGKIPGLVGIVDVEDKDVDGNDSDCDIEEDPSRKFSTGFHFQNSTRRSSRSPASSRRRSRESSRSRKQPEDKKRRSRRDSTSSDSSRSSGSSTDSSRSKSRSRSRSRSRRRDREMTPETYKRSKGFDGLIRLPNGRWIDDSDEERERALAAKRRKKSNDEPKLPKRSKKAKARARRKLPGKKNYAHAKGVVFKTLPKDLGKEEFYSMISPYGNIEKWEFNSREQSVFYDNIRSADDCMREFHKKVVRGCKIMCRYSGRTAWFERYLPKELIDNRKKPVPTDGLNQTEVSSSTTSTSNTTSQQPELPGTRPDQDSINAFSDKSLNLAATAASNQLEGSKKNREAEGLSKSEIPRSSVSTSNTASQQPELAPGPERISMSSSSEKNFSRTSTSMIDYSKNNDNAHNLDHSEVQSSSSSANNTPSYQTRPASRPEEASITPVGDYSSNRIVSSQVNRHDINQSEVQSSPTYSGNRSNQPPKPASKPDQASMNVFSDYQYWSATKTPSQNLSQRNYQSHDVYQSEGQSSATSTYNTDSHQPQSSWRPDQASMSTSSDYHSKWSSTRTSDQVDWSQRDDPTHGGYRAASTSSSASKYGGNSWGRTSYYEDSNRDANHCLNSKDIDPLLGLNTVTTRELQSGHPPEPSDTSAATARSWNQGCSSHDRSSGGGSKWGVRPDQRSRSNESRWSNESRRTEENRWSNESSWSNESRWSGENRWSNQTSSNSGSYSASRSGRDTRPSSSSSMRPDQGQSWGSSSVNTNAPGRRSSSLTGSQQERPRQQTNNVWRNAWAK